MVARFAASCVVAGACALASLPAHAQEATISSAWTERLRQVPFEASFRDDQWLGEQRSYGVPAANVILFDTLLNLVNRYTIGDEYKSTMASVRRNLHSSWTVDRDPFETNQLGHPYQGSMYHAFARSAGLNYWESL